MGSVNRDYVVQLPAIPRPGETVLGGELALHSGGKGGNQAVAATRMGARTSLIACVGDDADGAALLTDLQESGVDTTYVLVLDGVRTGVALILVDRAGENAIAVAPGANDQLGSEQVTRGLDRLLEAGDVLVASAEIPAETVDSAVAAATTRGARVVLNLAPYRDTPPPVLAVCDPLVVNEVEAGALLGVEAEGLEPEELIRRLAARATSVVATLGARGAVLAHPNGHVEHIPAPEVEVVDTTGAGDAFTGALAAALAEGSDLRTATERGVSAGSYAVGRPGAQASYPTRQDLRRHGLC